VKDFRKYAKLIPSNLTELEVEQLKMMYDSGKYQNIFKFTQEEFDGKMQKSIEYNERSIQKYKKYKKRKEVNRRQINYSLKPLFK
jgi:hypothetical protein